MVQIDILKIKPLYIYIEEKMIKASYYLFYTERKNYYYYKNLLLKGKLLGFHNP